jgi:hypothetical protein
MVVCDHSTVGAPPRLEFYDCCHLYKWGDKALTSVTQILEQIWPIKSEAPDWRRENARQRGVEVDRLFADYVNGTLVEIPAGTRKDTSELLLKLIDWFDRQGITDAKAQVRMADPDRELAGTADIVPPNQIWDLKTVYNLESQFGIQLGGYAHLHEVKHGKLPDVCGIVHLTERFKEPKFIAYEPQVVVSEFRTTLEFWQLTQRKRGRK